MRRDLGKGGYGGQSNTEGIEERYLPLFLTPSLNIGLITVAVNDDALRNIIFIQYDCVREKVMRNTNSL